MWDSESTTAFPGKHEPRFHVDAADCGLAALLSLLLLVACGPPTDRNRPADDWTTYDAHGLVRFKGPRGLVHEDSSVGAVIGEFVSERLSVHYQLDSWPSDPPDLATPPSITTRSGDLAQRLVDVDGLLAWESAYSGQKAGSRIVSLQFRNLEKRGYHRLQFVTVSLVSADQEAHELARRVIDSVEVLRRPSRR